MPVDDAISEVSSRKGVRSWVQFEQRTVEDKDESRRQGRFVGVDQDFVIITPAYGKDDVHKKASAWKLELKYQVDSGRLAQQDYDYYLARYDAWKKGLEMPPDGTPIKGWAVISPAQQKTIISTGVLTVEDLAAINDEGVKRIGMGAVELKRKANNWIAQAQDKGPLTQKMTAMQAENDQLQIMVKTLSEQVQKLVIAGQAGQAAPIESSVITTSDLIDDDPPMRRTKKG